MSNPSVTAAILRTSAEAGVDVFDFTTDGAGPFSPPSGCNGWKYAVISTEAVFGVLTETGGSPASSGIVGPTLGAGTLVSANGLFTVVGVGSGCVVMVRG